MFRSRLAHEYAAASLTSASGASMVFDARADGFVRGEGCAAPRRVEQLERRRWELSRVSSVGAPCGKPRHEREPDRTKRRGHSPAYQGCPCRCGEGAAFGGVAHRERASTGAPRGGSGGRGAVVEERLPAVLLSAASRRRRSTSGCAAGGSWPPLNHAVADPVAHQMSRRRCTQRVRLDPRWEEGVRSARCPAQPTACPFIKPGWSGPPFGLGGTIASGRARGVPHRPSARRRSGLVLRRAADLLAQARSAARIGRRRDCRSRAGRGAASRTRRASAVADPDGCVSRVAPRTYSTCSASCRHAW